MAVHRTLLVTVFLALIFSQDIAISVRMSDEVPSAPVPKMMPDAEGSGQLLRGIMQECVVGSAVSILTGYSTAPAFSSCLRAHVADSVARTDDAEGIKVTQSLSAEVDPRAADIGKGRTIAGLLSSSTIMDAANAFFETRAFRWHLNGVYPGLTLRLSPSISKGDALYPSTLEFLMEDRPEYLRLQHANDRNDRAYGQGRTTVNSPIQETGRLLLKKAILPLLLGLKFKVTTIFPILFALTALLASKALFIGKIALLASGIIGLGVVLFPAGLAGLSGILPFGYGGGLGGGFGGGFGGVPYGPLPYDRPYGFGATPALNPLLQYSAPNGPAAFSSGDDSSGGNRAVHHLLYDVHEGGDRTGSASSSVTDNGHREVVLPSFGGRRNFAWEDKRKRE